jgi:hypothetical protein
MPDFVSSKDHLPAVFHRLLVVGDEHIVIYLFIEIEICKCLLIRWLALEHFLNLFDIQFAEVIQVFIYFCDDDLLLFGERIRFSDALG